MGNGPQGLSLPQKSGRQSVASARSTAIAFRRNRVKTLLIHFFYTFKLSSAQ